MTLTRETAELGSWVAVERRDPWRRVVGKLCVWDSRILYLYTLDGGYWIYLVDEPNAIVMVELVDGPTPKP